MVAALARARLNGTSWFDLSDLKLPESGEYDDGLDLGEVHVGRVQYLVPAAARTPIILYGEMFDYTCPAGFLPDGLWLDAIAQLDFARDIHDNLIIDSGDVTLNVESAMHHAHLVGELNYINTFEVGSGVFAVNLR